jgi:hypothetical protein
LCMDLLQAKQEALDRRVPFPVRHEEVCDHCRSVFATLDVTRDVCRDLGKGDMPAAIGESMGQSLKSDADRGAAHGQPENHVPSDSRRSTTPRHFAIE